MKQCGKKNCHVEVWEGCVLQNFCAYHCRCFPNDPYREQAILDLRKKADSRNARQTKKIHHDEDNDSWTQGF